MKPPEITILTGAGISAESGIKTFRDHNGLWENHRIEDVATPEAFQRDPQTVYTFYNMRRRGLLGDDIKPNAAHKALARLEENYKGVVHIVTQNIDDLHERAGSRNIHHMHGELLKSRCLNCQMTSACNADMSHETVCPACRKSGHMRPHIVWFGEMPLFMDDITRHVQNCDIFVAIGTSGNVYPAAGFVQMAAEFGAQTVEINLEPSAVHGLFDMGEYGPAGQTVPKWVDNILAEGFSF